MKTMAEKLHFVVGWTCSYQVTGVRVHFVSV